MRITTRKLATMSALIAAFALFLTSPSSSQIFGRGGPVSIGEPTDPDGVLPTTQQAGVDLADYGLQAQAPQGEAEAQTWLDRVIELLRSLGLLPSVGED